MQFSGTIKRCLLGMVDVARITTTVASYVRTPELVSDGRDAVFAVICLKGSMLCTQGDEPVRVGPGEGIICDSVEPGGLQMEAETHCWALKVARADMAKTVPHIKRFAGRKLNNTGMAVKLLARYLDGLQGGDAVADEREARIFGEHFSISSAWRSASKAKRGSWPNGAASGRCAMPPCCARSSGISATAG